MPPPRTICTALRISRTVCVLKMTPWTSQDKNFRISSRPPGATTSRIQASGKRLRSMMDRSRRSAVGEFGFRNHQPNRIGRVLERCRETFPSNYMDPRPNRASQKNFLDAYPEQFPIDHD